MKKINRSATTLLTLSALTASAVFAGDVWNSDIWTTWHKKSLIQGLLALSKIREKLNRENLQDTYSPNSKAYSQPSCSPESATARMNDGSCNNPKDSAMGMVGMRFGRNVKDLSVISNKLDEKDILDPNPLVISRELLKRNHKDEKDESYKTAPVNMLAAAWIQFQNHDWFSHGENMNDISITRPYVMKDSGAGKGDLNLLIVPRTQPDNTQGKDNMGFPTFRNEVTHWWDGSQIYGSEMAYVDCAQKSPKLLRSCRGGRMLTKGGYLPLGKDGKEMTGFNRNWWVGIDFLHTLFVRNHNLIAIKLGAQYPSWDDEKLFNTARLVNVAMMAKFHTIEWTPGILANDKLNLAMHANWYGVVTGIKKLRQQRRNGESHVPVDGGPFLSMFAKFFVNSPVMIGLVGGKLDTHDKMYALTEEFTSVYRLHSLLPETLVVGNDHIPVGETREKKAPIVFGKYPLNAWANSMGKQRAGALTIGNFPQFLRNINIPALGYKKLEFQMDIAAIDILRDRERGVPRYNDFREQLNLKRVKDFEDLMPQNTAKNREITQKLRRIYGNIDRMDLLVGTLAESYRPQGFGFGETMFQVFVLMASRRLQADRFFTTDYNERVYSKLGLQLIDEATFKSVLVNNVPSLDASKIPANAFAPW